MSHSNRAQRLRLKQWAMVLWSDDDYALDAVVNRRHPSREVGSLLTQLDWTFTRLSRTVNGHKRWRFVLQSSDPTINAVQTVSVLYDHSTYDRSYKEKRLARQRDQEQSGGPEPKRPRAAG